MSPAEDVKLLSELLAVIHRDGGQYQDAHGTAKAVADAMQLSSERIVEAEDAKRIGGLVEAGNQLREMGRARMSKEVFWERAAETWEALNGANGNG